MPSLFEEKLPIDCFISMPFSDDFDNVYNYGLQNLQDHVKIVTLHLIRLDKQAYRKRRIEENVLRHIDTSDLLLADITRHPTSGQPNVSVVHEIGYAQGRRTPVILIGQTGSHENLPANLKGSFVQEYDRSDETFTRFTRDLARQLEEIIKGQVLLRPRGDYQVECFTARHKIRLDRMMANATGRINILTTNLNYTATFLKTALREAVSANQNNPTFKVEILTMDPESDVANARALQLGGPIRQYRDELRRSLDEIRDVFADVPQVEIATHRTLPTQMTFVIDDTVVTGIVSLGQQSREGIHFVLYKLPAAANDFLSHFRSLKMLAFMASPR
jgi:hypothetical protein